MTRIVRLDAFGGPEHLRAEDMASPQPGPGEVRLRTQAGRVTRDHYSFMNGRQFKGHGFEQPSLPRAATASSAAPAAPTSRPGHSGASMPPEARPR